MTSAEVGIYSEHGVCQVVPQLSHLQSLAAGELPSLSL